MDLRQLEILKAIAEAGSFTAAGDKLQVSQSAISRQILLLERELKEPLFVRRGRRVVITQAGESLVRLSGRVFGDIGDTLRQIADQQRHLSGVLRVAGGMTVCLYVLPQVLREYRRAHAQVDVRLVTGGTPRLVRELRAGAADIALLTLPIEGTDLVSMPVMREELLLVMRPDHPLAAKKRIVATDLVRQPFVLFEPHSNSRRVVDTFFGQANVEPRIVLETENVEILKALVRAGMGLTVIPYQAVAREVRGGQLACARIGGARLERETGWVYPRASRLPRTVEELMRAFDQVKGRLRLSPDDV
ncbi:MAG: LysR family transcriptional regulator [Vicinamibacterales bacterium]